MAYQMCGFHLELTPLAELVLTESGCFQNINPSFVRFFNRRSNHWTMNTAPTQSPTALRPLKIGNVEIGFPVVQAALSGYSDWPMRVIAKRLGASYTICEVMLDQFLVSLKERKRTSHFLHISDEESPVGGQLMGAEPDQFAAGAVKLVEAGFDIIDINFGCPVKKVLGRCRGGFHLGPACGRIGDHSKDARQRSV